MKIHGVAAIAVAHKIGAILFVALLLILYIPKSIRKWFFSEICGIEQIN
jgi:hypothetical protein